VSNVHTQALENFAVYFGMCIEE